MTWQSEFNEGYNCPPCPDWLQDLSWHNDACPCYGTWDDKGGFTNLAIWMEHPNPEKREINEGGRYCVIYYPNYTHDDTELIYSGDDWYAALDAAERQMNAMELADAFCDELSANLTPEQIREVVERNKTDKYRLTDSCATHDFCDANMVMDDAAKNIDLDIWPNDQLDTDLVNRAWTIAARNEFKSTQSRETEE